MRACPKCGSTDITLDRWNHGDGMKTLYRYMCENGDAWDTWCYTEEEAEEDWNKVPEGEQK